MDKDQAQLLINHIEKMNLYDLERLKVCFEYELSTNTADKKAIGEIIEHIDKYIEIKRQEK